MEKKIVVSKHFQKNTFFLHKYLLNESSSKIAYQVLDRLQQRIDLLIQHPEIGKPSQKKPNIKSLILQPHNRIYYRINKNTIELLFLFDMRRKKKPY